MNSITRTLLVISLLCLISGLISGVPVRAETEIVEQSYQVEANATFELRNKNGNVTIQGWEQATLYVRAEKKTQWGGKLENVEIQVTPGTHVVIETVHRVKNPRVSVNYEIRAPKHLFVRQVDTSNGRIEISAAQGNMHLKSSNGSIEARNIAGTVTADTSNGQIELHDIQGTVAADTSNSSIEVRNVTGIRSLDTSNGSINADIPMVQNDLDIKTSNSSVSLYLAPDIQANLNLKTSNGHIAIHDGLEVMVSGELSDTKLKGRLGEGGGEITVKTSNGNINLYALELPIL